ncbi:MAG: RHS repeat-associated core domain-containing protein, partial [Bacteroidetes bacterium]
ASGKKWRKITDGVVHEYVNGAEYVDGELLHLMHAEGRFIPAENPGEDGRVEYWLKDHLGNTRVAIADLNQNGYVDLDDPETTQDEGELMQENHYYPFGLDHLGNWVATVGPENDYLYNGKEWNEDIGWYDYGARWYDPAIGRWNAIDPLAEDYYPYSPYNYVMNNPVMLIDPDGMSATSTDVRDNGDGTYTVVGGDLTDGDKGIYVVDETGNRTGEKIGESLTMYSFYNADTQDPEDQQGWKGVIDVNSTESGDLVGNFMKEAENISIISYMPNATDGKEYDFKRGGDPESNDRNFHHRGSLWGTKADGTKVYGSARDAGNFAAGYIAGLKGLSWGAAKAGFNSLELVKSFHVEGQQSTSAQKLGHNKGYPIGRQRAAKKQIKKSRGWPTGLLKY